MASRTAALACVVLAANCGLYLLRDLAGQPRATFVVIAGNYWLQTRQPGSHAVDVFMNA